jgi:hypothetical protein
VDRLTWQLDDKIAEQLVAATPENNRSFESHTPDGICHAGKSSI